MVNSQQLQIETSTLLKEDVIAVGIFDVSLTAGKRNVAPAAAGLAAGFVTKQIQKKIIERNNNDDDENENEYTMGNRLITGAVGLATGVGTQQFMKHHNAKKNGLTPIMIVAVTRNKIFLLDWKGSHNKGTGPKLVLIEFNRNQAKIKNRSRGIVHQIIEIEEDGHHCKIECNLGATHSNKMMNREVIRIMKSEVDIPIALSCAKSNSTRSFNKPATNFRWASTGGGWPAMVASMAFANVFSQAGLITNSSSKFSATSFQSGATWFSVQFFYSPQFFDKIVNSNPKQLSDFVIQWMNSYQNMFETNSKRQKRNSFLKDFTESTTLQVLADYSSTFNEHDGDWANFCSSFLEAASKGYGDPTLVNKKVGAENRVHQMLNTDLYLQTTLAPNSRKNDSNVGVFLGPIGDRSKIYSLPTTIQYSVSKDDTLYYTTLPNGDLNLNKYTKTLNKNMNFPNGLEEFGTFSSNNTNQTVLIDRSASYKYVGKMATPFGGAEPNVGQISSVSSAAAGPLSPLVPSTMSQVFSVERNNLKGKPAKKAAFDVMVDNYNKTSKFNGVSVSSQWPNDGENNSDADDARFIDGGFADGPTLGLNIGQYQTRENGDIDNTTLKFVLTNDAASTPHILAYFKTDFNKNIAPGDFLWPADKDGKAAFQLPNQSPQIFDTKMDSKILDSITQPIDGLTVTTALISTTTIANPAFKTKAGQKVEILLITLNSKIPIAVIGLEQIRKQKWPLADMARDISSNKELLRRVKSFVDDA
jgi:hypothetical protein